jgi:hypothetical protein
MNAKQLKLGLATIGASALTALGALGMIFGDVGAAAAPQQVIGAGAPQAGKQTVTTTTPPTAPVISMASPVVTATTPSGFAPAPHP